MVYIIYSNISLHTKSSIVYNRSRLNWMMCSSLKNICNIVASFLCVHYLLNHGEENKNNLILIDILSIFNILFPLQWVISLYRISLFYNTLFSLDHSYNVQQFVVEPANCKILMKDDKLHGTNRFNKTLHNICPNQNWPHVCLPRSFSLYCLEMELVIFPLDKILQHML